MVKDETQYLGGMQTVKISIINYGSLTSTRREPLTHHILKLGTEKVRACW